MINYMLNDNMLTLFLKGRIDSENALTTEKEIVGVCEANPADNLALDMEALEYISSAGLRVVLRLRKDHPTLMLVNVSADVYEILEMTGFTEMLPVEKAYRHLSVDGCEVIGQGANGKVYRLNPDTIIKVYYNSDSLPDIQRERELARKAFIKGIPTAIPYDVVKVGEKYGAVYELLNASSFGKIVNKEPERLDELVRMSVELLKRIHGTELQPGEMPDEKQVVLGWAEFLKDYLPADQYAKLHGLIEAVPEDHHMMHGDYHVKNVMLQNGEVLLIDMDTLCMGHPVFEFASIFLAYVGYNELNPNPMDEFLEIPRAVGAEFLRRTICYYYHVSDETAYNKILDRARLIGYTRMMRRTIRRCSNTEEGQTLIAHCAAQLAKLLEQVDSLVD